MLLPIKKTKYYKDLDRATLFISKIFRYAEKSVRPLNKDCFIKALGEAGEWFIGINEAGVKTGFEGILKMNQSQCREVRKAFLNDIRFARTSKTDSFEFKTQKLDIALKKALKDFLDPFYEYLLGNIGISKIKNLSVEKLTRQLVRRGYILENRECIRVCPACLGGINLKVDLDEENHISEESVGKDFYAQLDHYLPKKTYPALIISSDNLVPICGECNNPVVKGDIDPIDIHGAGCILNVFLPYKYCIMEHSELEFIGRSGFREVKLKANDDKETYMAKRIENFERTYKLYGRWTGRIKGIHEDIIKVIITDLEVEERNPDNESILKGLKKVIKDAWKKQKSVPDSYLQMCYAEWLLKKRFKELCDEICTSMKELYAE
jgi:hypothetical protein